MLLKKGDKWLLSILNMKLGWVARAGINKKANEVSAGVWFNVKMTMKGCSKALYMRVR